MNILSVLLIALLLQVNPPGSITLIDVNFKKPVRQSDHFNHQLFLEKYFPVFTSDIAAIDEASSLIAKMIYKGTTCNGFDTISLANSYYLVQTACGDKKTVSVNLHTVVDGEEYSLRLINREADMRVAQKKLLDFAGYLTNGK